MTFKRIRVQTAENIFKLGIATSEVLEQICPILESILAPFTIFFVFQKQCCQKCHQRSASRKQLLVTN